MAEKQKKHLTVKELPFLERPYEKCETFGASRLTDAELLAVIIRTGSGEERAGEVANRILKLAGENGLIGLHKLSFRELTSIHGIGRVKAIQLQCVAELSIRMAYANREAGIHLTSPDMIAKRYMQQMRHLNTEHVILILLDTKNKVLKELTISSGSVNASILSSREIFLNAFKYEAVYIILLHNHPSGDPSPSREDLQITLKIREAGELIGIPLMDHIIIGDNKYISLKEQGIV